eukprot:1158153-Pelagomonas_calceolata.AAC.6
MEGWLPGWAQAIQRGLALRQPRCCFKGEGLQEPRSSGRSTTANKGACKVGVCAVQGTCQVPDVHDARLATC